MFRDERPERVVEIVNGVGLERRAAARPRARRRRSAGSASGCRFVIQGSRPVIRAVAPAAEGGADVVLLDAAEPGSGRVFDWALAEGVPGGVRAAARRRAHPENVADAIRRVRPWGVDVATGVETEPGSGRKDAAEAAAFLEAARGAGDELEADGWRHRRTTRSAPTTGRSTSARLAVE